MTQYFLLCDKRKTVMDARLVVLEPRTEKWKVVQSPLPATIGRGSEADVQIGDAWVSRRHCQLDQVDGALVLRDLGSRHGTLVNRAYISEMELSPGDEITIGTTSLRVTLDTMPLEPGEGSSPSIN
jgi:pSer/pThr/pTyr-binding forkhead associated (FHA) protein